MLVEHTIGQLKQRFRQLYHIKSQSVEFISHFIRACCVLHNICIDNDVIFEVNVENLDMQREENIGQEMVQEETNDVGINYRNYVASLLNI